MFNKENVEFVKKMNEYMGTNHRFKPYDMNNPLDLEQALTLAVAAYCDYSHYATTLFIMDDDFDESIENYDTATWIHLYRDPKKSDMLAVECAKALNKARVLFDKLEKRAKEQCAMILKAVLSTPPTTQKAVLGTTYKIIPAEMNEKIDVLLDALDETDEIKHENSIPENFSIFIKFVEEAWGDYKQ